jgi:patatin-like phospholipase/acyl hydrolase
VAQATKILSIDGGGIRGVIPAMVLAEIERQTKTRICHLFDFIAGTSTGGIITLGVTKPGQSGQPEYSAEDLVKLYETEGRVIFHESLPHLIRSIHGVASEKFPSTGIDRVLHRYFGESRLKDALKPVLIPAYEIESRAPWFFRSENAKRDPRYDFLMRDVARATSAAPTYFSPAKIEVDSDPGYWTFVDGGVFANNPTMCALVDALSRSKAEDVLVVSLGTGTITRRIPYKRAKHWGLAGWARKILDVVFDGVSETIDYQTRQLCDAVDHAGGFCSFPAGTRHYYRFQPRLGSEDEQRLDEADADHVHQLKLVAIDLINQERDALKQVCDALTS